MKRVEMGLMVGLFLSVSAFAAAPEAATREARFADPPHSARILPIHHGRSGKGTDVEKEIQDLERNGFGGLASNVSFGTDYLRNPQQWNAFRLLAQRLREKGSTLWLYDENGYPSGTARDLVLKDHPEWEARGLLIAVTNVPAGAMADLALPPGVFRRALACPLVKNRPDLARGMLLDRYAFLGRVRWRAPAEGGTWRVYAATEDRLYESTHAALSLALKQPYINLLMPEPTARFIALTHERYAVELGTNALRAVTSTFTDEPSLMSCWFRPMPYFSLPWCPDLPDDYRTATGRDLLMDFPALLDDDAAGRAVARRYAFWNIVADRISKHFFGQLAHWAKQRGILSGGHLLAEEGIETHVPYYGDFFRCLRGLTAPGIDCLQSIPENVSWMAARFGGSAGALNGSRRVMCEVSDHCQRYRPKGDQRPIYQVSESEINGTLNRLIWGGINTFTSYYDWRPFDAATIRRINTIAGRSVTLMSEGTDASSVAVLYPSETLMTLFRPAQQGVHGAGVARAAAAFRSSGEALFSHARPFLIVDSRSLGESVVQGDSLTYGALRWRVVVLPRAITLPVETVRRLHEFWRNGGCVIAVGDLPTHGVAAFPDQEICRLSLEMFGADARRGLYSSASSPGGGVGTFLPDDRVAFLSRVVDRVLTPELIVTSGARKALRLAHRRTQRGDLFFLVNDTRKPWSGTIRFCKNETIEVWDPQDGTHGAAIRQTNGDIPLTLSPYSAKVLSTSSAFDPQRCSAFEREPFPMPKPMQAPIRMGNASAARDVSYREMPYKTEGRTLRVQILKSAVDTFLFLPFIADGVAMPKDATGICLELQVVDEQPYAPEFLVFAERKDGVRYLAASGCSLAGKRAGRVFIPLSRFSPFGHQGGVGELRPEEIRQISVGFGGYFGTAGETITFSVLPPQYYVEEP